MKFVKMHGAGNDYVYVDAFQQQIDDPATLAQQVSDRNFGIGSDGLILILPSDLADVRMRMFNADGSEAEMCGNGIRCVAKYAYDRSLVDSTSIRIETGAGVRTLELFPNELGLVEKVRVNMGAPALLRSELPMYGEPCSQFIDEEITACGDLFRATCISMGNPHCVVFVEDLDSFDLPRFGAALEHHPLFPRRINVEFVQVLSPREVRQRTWERGAGETLACGTGASAVTVAGVLTGRTERSILNHLSGGDLEMEWSHSGDVFMAGPAVEVFEGHYSPR